MPINVIETILATILDAGFTVEAAKGSSLAALTASLVRYLREASKHSRGFIVSCKVVAAINAYQGLRAVEIWGFLALPD